MFWSIRELEVSGRVVLLRSFIHMALWSPRVRTMRPVAMAVVEFYISLAHLSCTKAVIFVQLLVREVILGGYPDRLALQHEPLGFENTLVLLSPLSRPLHLHAIVW